MIDTHAHIYDEYFLKDIQTHLDEFVEAGIKQVWLPNCDVTTTKDLLLLCENYPSFFLPMIGLHPTYVKEDYENQLGTLEKIIFKTTNLLAIGEIGLDYYWDTTFKNEQIISFEKQCHWAMEKHIWVDIHCRKAYADLIKIIRKKEFKELNGIIHCFSGDASEAKHCVENGFLLGIGGVITYKNANLFESIKDIPLDYIVLETDAPYLTPVPYRGSPNSPKYIPLIAQKLADLFQVSIDELLKKTTENASRLKKFSGIE